MAKINVMIIDDICRSKTIIFCKRIFKSAVTLDIIWASILSDIKYLMTVISVNRVMNFTI